jgi:hypothetical protein
MLYSTEVRDLPENEPGIAITGTLLEASKEKAVGGSVLVTNALEGLFRWKSGKAKRRGLNVVISSTSAW